jgi:hypothetical protein
MKLNTIQRCLLAALLVAGAPGYQAIAAPITVPDFSFEDTAFASTNLGGTVGGAGTNWLNTGNGGNRLQNFNTALFAGTDTLPAPADGTNCFVEILNGAPSFCWQDIGHLQTNTVYTLTVAIGQTFGAGSGTGKIALINGFSPFQTVLAELPFDSGTVTPGGFSDFSLVYTSGYQASGDLTILLEGDATGVQIVYDNIRLDATTLPLSPTAVLPTLSTPSSTIYKGTLVTLSELPAGAAPFHYQWQSDNGTTGTTFTDIASANNSTYVADTTGFALSSPVEYRVVVTNSLGGSTSAPVTLTAIQGPPVITRDTLPVTVYTIEGDRLTFTASVDGSRPLAYQWMADTGAGPTPILNATNTTLTLTNLKLTDAGYYSLQASNEFSVVNSTASQLIIDPVPADVSGIIISPASQLGFGGNNTFVPTWVLAPNSLIAGLTPSSSVGDFSLERAGGTNVLTDGLYGTLPPEGNASVQLATCGRISSGAGSSIVYTLPASATGYDLTNVVVYGGWSDAGRDQQQYIVYYSTVANRTNFNNQIAYVNFNPTNTANAQSATRITITGTNAVLARNVAAVMFDFNILQAATENGYTGYAEFQVFGVPSAPKPVISVDTQPATGSDVEGSQMTFVAAFSSGTPITYQWQADKGSGPVDIPGATNTTLTLTHLQLSDTGLYSLKASNASGISVSRSSTFVVNPLPAPDGNGVIVSPANQTGSGRFTPTWSISANSLIAGFAPSARGSSVGSYMLEGAGGLGILTDGQYGGVGGDNTALATCGPNAGHSITYTLAGSQSGYDITNIVVYAGWGDNGRDQQAYTVYYSTIAAPDSFTALSSTTYNPNIPGGVRSADRVTFSPSTALPLAANVARVMFDFTNPSGENFYSGFAEIAVFGSPSAAVSQPPVVFTDTLPATGSDVVGSEVTFTAGFAGTTPMTYQWRKDTGGGPVEILNATNNTLTLSNLQLSDSASYSLLASNDLGTATSTPNTFTVNAAPTPANGMLVATANQLSGGDTFTPTWIVAPGSLLAGLAPSSVGSGSFTTEGGGGTVVLTDGKFGSVGGGNSSLATCGVGVGTTVTYTLAGAATGYDLARIVTYGGWGDAGRDQQHYTVSYSTVAAPATFVNLVSASYNPPNAAGKPSADRVTITPFPGTLLARNVAAVKFDFTNPTGENGWSGYAELSVFGVKSPPQIGSITASGGNLRLTGIGGTAGASYTWLTTTNVASPVATWTTNSTGVFDASGAFSNSIPVNPSEPARFFWLRTP